MSATVLIAGGAGQFGSRLADALAAGGTKVVAFDSMVTGLGERIKHGPLVKADLRETPRIVRSLKEYSCSHLFHCALVADGEPAALYEQHLTTALSAIQAAKDAGVPMTLLAPEGSTFGMLERICADCAAAMKLDFAVISWNAPDALARAISRVR